jgi:hypothetical protein
LTAAIVASGINCGEAGIGDRIGRRTGDSPLTALAALVDEQAFTDLMCGFDTPTMLVAFTARHGFSGGQESIVM